MYILTDQTGHIVMTGVSHDLDIHPEADPNSETHKLIQKDGSAQYATANNFYVYFIDDGFVPVDFYQNFDRYLYKEGEGLILDQNWRPAPPTSDEMIAQNAAKLEYLSIMTGIDISEV